MIRGIDVSAFQGVVDWKRVREAGIEFAIIRAGYGDSITQKDEYFERNMKNALAAGIKAGAYWFSYAASVGDAKREADIFREVMRPYRRRASYPLYFDWEYASYDYAVQQGVTPTKRLVTDMARAFMDRLREDRWYSGWYTNYDYYGRMYDPAALKDYTLWLASYGGAPTVKCDLQQTSSTGRVSGIPGNVDTDRAFVDFNALLRRDGWNGFDRDPDRGDGSTGEDGCGNPLPEPKTCRIGRGGVRVYERAYIGAKTIAQPARGTEVAWISDDGWGWSEIKYGNLRGWVQNEFLACRETLSRYRTGVIGGNDVNVRDKPSLAGRVLFQVNSGQRFTVISIDPEKRMRVKIDGRSAYLYYDPSYIRIET